MLLDKFYRVELDNLRAEVAEQQAVLKTLNAKGGKARLTTCGQARRLCVQIDKEAGEYEEGDYYVIRGY